MKYIIDASCGCSIGKARTNNEDNFYFDGETLAQENRALASPLHKRFDQETVCFGVFDGMGGAEDGQVASFLAASSFQKAFRNRDQNEPLSEVFFVRAVEQMNTSVVEEAERQKNNMGTTAVMLGISGETLFVCNVGDSRACRFRDGRMVQLSLDHVEGTIPAGRRKPRLSQCIGISPEEFLLDPYIVEGFVRAGDVYLLCSDGLTDMVTDEEIVNLVINSPGAEECVRLLIHKALENGGKDNITVIVVRIVEEDPA